MPEISPADLADYSPFVFGAFFPAWRALKSWPVLGTSNGPKLTLFLLDVFRGAAMAPMAQIILGAFFPAYLPSKFILVLAGIIGLFSAWRADRWAVEFFVEQKVRRRRNTKSPSGNAKPRK
jgi:hypothetical protein